MPKLTIVIGANGAGKSTNTLPAPPPPAAASVTGTAHRRNDQSRNGRTR